MKKEQTQPDVRVGDVWEDCDKRVDGRRLTVTAVDEAHVTCTTFAKGRISRIKRSRFVPISTGYKLVVRDGKAVR